MKIKYFLMLLLCISCSVYAIGQTAYYYYEGNKVPLTLNENKVCVSIPKASGLITARVLASVEVQQKAYDDAFDILVVTKPEFEKLVSQNFWAEDAKSVILTSSYYTENKEEVFATPYLNVKLNKEEDVNLLKQYAETFRFEIVRNMPSMPLWYILSVTPESGKNPLECANELFESGDFAASVPDLVDLLDETTNVRNIPTATTAESTEMYNLQGRRLAQPPTKGIYVKNGKVIIVK